LDINKGVVKDGGESIEGQEIIVISNIVKSVNNNATREQLKGRINRLGQKTEPLLYKTVHIGLLTTIMENHDKAKSLSAALQEMAKGH
jgi:hypothetical protein